MFLLSKFDVKIYKIIKFMNKYIEIYRIIFLNGVLINLLYFNIVIEEVSVWRDTTVANVGIEKVIKKYQHL